MTRAGPRLQDEYLGEEKAAALFVKNAPRLTGACATDRLLTDNQGGFSLGGHRLSSLYRRGHDVVYWLSNGYFAAFSSLKYSNSTLRGVTAPEMRAW